MNILQYYDVMLEINAALVSLKTFTFYFVFILVIHFGVLFCVIFHFS